MLNPKISRFCSSCTQLVSVAAVFWNVTFGGALRDIPKTAAKEGDWNTDASKEEELSLT